jgi:Ca2+/Na+ antiporter
LTSGEIEKTFDDATSTSWSTLAPYCDDADIVCNCSGAETIQHHSHCDHEIFGVPLQLKDDVLHSIYILAVVIYGFIGIAIVCDTYFEPSLEIISDKLKLSPDVAGATFMAMGSSAPELFTSLSDNFITQNNVGVGTIVGSALFNILIIVALSAAVAKPPKGVQQTEEEKKRGIKVDWRPVARDVIFYACSIGLLIAFIWDESVYWWEALIMLLAYFIYIIYMTQNAKIIAA